MLGGCCTAPCSGAERRNKVLDEVSTAFHGGAAAVKERLYFTLPGTTTAQAKA